VAPSPSQHEVATTLGLSGGSTTSVLKGHAARLGLDATHFDTAPEVVAPERFEVRPDLTSLSRAGSMLAAAWLTLCGYDISWPLEPCRYDLLAGRNGQILRVQVKTTRTWGNGGWKVSLSTTSGGRRIYDPDDIDYFFVIDGDLEYYLVPVASVGGRYSVTLSRYQQFRLDQQPAVALPRLTEPGPSSGSA
jgi:PD-(D/E)XK nuclease superfamily protein